MSDPRLTRWRLVLGGGEADGTGARLQGQELRIDQALAAVYDAGADPGKAGLAASAPRVARWLTDIRACFPSSVVRVLQRDALDRLHLKQMLLEPEMLEAVEPDVHLVADLLALSSVIPLQAKETARQVVRRVVADVMRRVARPMQQAVYGSLNRGVRNLRPRLHEMDWNRTVRANLRHYQPRYKAVVPERRIGYGRRRSALRDVVLAVDQSGSMASSVVYAGIFGAVLASLPAVRTHVVVFDTSVVDLSEKATDPVELLFGVQLGGGTDINRALAYCQELVGRPSETILVLISDMFEGGRRDQMLKRVGKLVNDGVTVVVLLALSDDGAPVYDHDNAAALASFGIPCFACTPDLFPEMMAAALGGHDLFDWAGARGIVTARGWEEGSS